MCDFISENGQDQTYEKRARILPTLLETKAGEGGVKVRWRGEDVPSIGGSVGWSAVRVSILEHGRLGGFRQLSKLEDVWKWWSRCC